MLFNLTVDTRESGLLNFGFREAGLENIQIRSSNPSSNSPLGPRYSTKPSTRRMCARQAAIAHHRGSFTVVYVLPLLTKGRRNDGVSLHGEPQPPLRDRTRCERVFSRVVAVVHAQLVARQAGGVFACVRQSRSFRHCGALSSPSQHAVHPSAVQRTAQGGCCPSRYFARAAIVLVLSLSNKVP